MSSLQEHLVFPWVSVPSPSAVLSILGGAAGSSLELLHLWGLMLQFPCSLCSPDSIKLLPNLFFFLFIFSSLLKISCSWLHRHRKYRITDCSLKRYFYIYNIYKIVNILNLFPYTVHFILHCTEVSDNCNSWKRLLRQRYWQRNCTPQPSGGSWWRLKL